MIHQELLRQAVAGRHPVLQRFVETLAPQILLQFSSLPALGGANDTRVFERDNVLPDAATEYTTKAREAFGKLHDQSLSAHLFNGIFAGSRIAELLPHTLSDREWQVWILGFIVHDYTKAKQIEIQPGYITEIRRIIEHLGVHLHFDGFFQEWRNYLDDIVFIAQNAQKRKDANLNLSAYPGLQLNGRRLNTLRFLASFADVLVHITRPADIAERDSRGRDIAQNLRITLAQLFPIDQTPRLAYHQLTEVRGLLSNLVNNALMRALEQQGYQPYLFFPNGVVYIDMNRSQAAIDGTKLIGDLWREVGAKLSGIDTEVIVPATGTDGIDDAADGDLDDSRSEQEGGMRITRSKDYLKVPPVLYELLSFEQIFTAARAVSLNITSAKTVARLGAEVAEDQGVRITGKPQDKQKRYIEFGQPFAESQGLPTDVRVDQLAEFSAFVHRRLKDLFPTGAWLDPLIPDFLELRTAMPLERVYRNNGGTPTGWFYAAAHYVKNHPDLDPDGLASLLAQMQTHVLNFLREHGLPTKPGKDAGAWATAYQRFMAGQVSGQQVQGRFEAAFRDYLEHIITIDGQTLSSPASATDRWTRELQQYTERKASNKVQCSLCSSPYEAREQSKSEVLFKPQQYSNKMRLDTSVVVRGICPICALEMMLRQVNQGMRAGTAQDEKPITLYLYPTYFFTSETAQVIHNFIAVLRDLYLPSMIFNHLERNKFDLETLAQYEDFVALKPEAETRSQWTLRKPTFSQDDPASLFFFTLRPAMSKPTDTDAWVVPTFYALALPLLLDVKVVASSSFVPLFNSGADFRSTAILDAPHGFTKYVLQGDQFRVDQLNDGLWPLLRLYELHLDVFSEPKDLHWGMLNTVAKDIATDPLYVFSYFDRKQRTKEDSSKQKASKAKASKATSDANGEGIPLYILNRYISICKTLGGETAMNFIGKLVDAYAQFYRADYKHLDSAYTILRPLGTAIDVVKNSLFETDEEDLRLLIAGAINDEMIRVRDDPATTGGYDPIWFDTKRGEPQVRLALSLQAIETFADLFVQSCFNDYCKGERGILRERANRLRSAARFYYLTHYARRN